MLRHEADEDLELVCWNCHPRADEDRRRNVPAHAWACRVQGWADACGFDDLAPAENNLERHLEEDRGMVNGQRRDARRWP